MGCGHSYVNLTNTESLDRSFNSRAVSLWRQLSTCELDLHARQVHARISFASTVTAPSLPTFATHLNGPLLLLSTAAAYDCCLLLLPSAAAFHLLSLPAFTRYNLHCFLGSYCCPHTIVSLRPSLLALPLCLSLYKVCFSSAPILPNKSDPIIFRFWALFCSFISLSVGFLSLLYSQVCCPFHSHIIPNGWHHLFCFYPHFDTVYFAFLPLLSSFGFPAVRYVLYCLEIHSHNSFAIFAIPFALF